MTARVIHADCLDAMREMPDACVDAIITDPPYGLSFMGRDWDHGVPGPAFWTEALRVAKPGAHLVAFGGTRTYHRLACAIEDAGWEVRDCLSWLYGSGFPKSLDVSKAIDKGSAETRDRALRFTAWMRATGITIEQINTATNSAMGSHYLTDKSQPAIATADMFDLLRPHLPEVPEEIERLVAERTGIEWTAYKQRAVVGVVTKGSSPLPGNHDGTWADGQSDGTFNITAPATDAARQWQGWGTALKPAWEPCILARKPLISTVAANVTAYGTGAINVDACRIGTEGGGTACNNRDSTGRCLGHNNAGRSTSGPTVHGPDTSGGRWPANVALDEEAATMLGEPARFFYTAKASRSERFAYLTCDCETVNIEAWVNEDQSQHAQTVVTSPQRDISEELLRDVSDSCTLLSGNDNTGRFQRDFKSTTSTTINSTIDLKISSLSLPPSTSASIADANCEATSGGNHADCVDSKNQSTKRTGTSRPKVGRCTGAVVPATSARLSNPSVCVRCGAKVRIEAHPTQKPVALMRWLVRMVTPPGGVVLDPFCGSGTTLVAAIEEGFDCIGVEREAEYVAIIEARVAAAQQRPQRVAKPKPKRQPVKVQPAATAPPTPIASAPLPGQLALAWGAE